jgi:dihydroflavonol-4-reductase
MKVLVLGATGFIGGQIARRALQTGHDVRALRRRHTVGALADLTQRIEWVAGDLNDSESLVAAAQGCDVMFHAAAYYPSSGQNVEHLEDIEAQVNYAQAQMGRVLQAARKAKLDRVVYTSSLTTVGPPGEPGRLADERDYYCPGSTDSAYYETKFAMEAMALQAADEGLPVVVLLPTAVFGPGDVKPTTGQLLMEVAKGRMPFYIDVVTNLVDGRDVAAAHLSALEQGRMGQRYIIGGHNVTLRQGLMVAAQAAGVPAPQIRLPRAIAQPLLRLVERLPGIELSDHVRTMHLWQPLSTIKAERELKLVARPLEQTVGDTLRWFQEQGYLRG